ncbi:MAG TPA: carbohydrate-binding protein [Kofleriaceae bacterium]|nr:carbohydrate-binding protein [Kofleriaceae bacterium]
MRNQASLSLVLSVIACSGAACATDDTSSVDRVELAAVDCNAATPWATSTPFAVGAAVTFGGSVYECIQAHTSQPDWTPPAVPALWRLADCNGGGDDGGDDGGADDSGDDGGTDDGGDDGGGDGGGTAPGFIFGAYKDTSINMDFNTNVVSTLVPGTRTPLANDMTANGAGAITLAFATGQCGTENWGGVPGATLAAANVPLLDGAGIDYILSTGGAAGSFTCNSDAGFATFLGRWLSPHLVGVDFDIEAGQSEADILELVRRIDVAHDAHPGLRFSLTIATLANTDGSESLNIKGIQTLQAVQTVFGGVPSFVTINLMTMDYGGPSPFVCVVAGGTCDMGQSAIQAARNLNASHGVPFSRIELTPMIGGNDVQSNVFRLPDVNEVASFVIGNGLAGVHYWSYDRDVDCPPGSASPVCNSLGDAGPHGFLHRFQDAGLE